MGSLRASKTVAWLAMLTVVAVFIVAVCLRVIVDIWDYSAIFCAFMAVFCHLMAINLAKMSASASRKLDIAAFIFLCLAVVAIIVIYILNQF